MVAHSFYTLHKISSINSILELYLYQNVKSFLIVLCFCFLFVFLFMAVLGLRCCAWAFSNCGERGLLFVVVHRLLIAVASLVAEHGL